MVVTVIESAARNWPATCNATPMPAIAEQTTAQHMPQTGAFMMIPPNSVSNSQPGFRSVLGLAWSFKSKLLKGGNQADRAHWSPHRPQSYMGNVGIIGPVG